MTTVKVVLIPTLVDVGAILAEKYCVDAANAGAKANKLLRKITEMKRRRAECFLKWCTSVSLLVPLSSQVPGLGVFARREYLR